MTKTFLLALIIVACASIAAAQVTYKRWEIFGGYSHNRVDTGIGDFDPDSGEFDTKRESFHGFEASVTGNFSRYLGLKGDVSGHYKNKIIPFDTVTKAVDMKSSLYNFLAGVQLKDNSTESTFKPFAHVLPGVAYVRNRFEFRNEFCNAVAPGQCPANITESHTAFAAALGGGLDIRTTNRIDIRAIQIDYNPTRSGDPTQHNIRIGVGIVIH